MNDTAATAKSPSSPPIPDRGADIRLEDIVQEFPNPDGGKVRVIDGISLHIDKPGIYMLLGPSGCGKSTLLYMMGGVRPSGNKYPSSGRILIDGQPCIGAHEDAVMVFQRYANRPDLTVRENIAFPFRFSLWRKRVTLKEANARIDRVMQAVGLADKAKLLPAQLSGGQNQRVALARALVLQPRILLMDEPFGALDAQIREEMQTLLVSLWEQQRCVIVFVTHDVTEALRLGDRIIVLSTQPARIADDFTIDEQRPRGDAWQRSALAQQFEDRIIKTLHAAGGKGQVRVSV